MARLDDLEALGYRYLLSRPAEAKELAAARPGEAACVLAGPRGRGRERG